MRDFIEYCDAEGWERIAAGTYDHDDFVAWCEERFLEQEGDA